MTTYYVAKTGNDANSGRTEAEAWRTIQKAANTMVEGDTVYINGEPLDEPYAIYEGVSPFSKFGPIEVPAEHVFMMGDNRNNSADSRVWGYLDLRLVDGKAMIIHWSWRGNTYGVRWGRIGKLLG